MSGDLNSTPAGALAEASSVLGEYGLRMLSRPAPVASGTLNWNYRFETQRGPVFARLHRQDVSLQRVRDEHELLTWVGERGVPVVRPLPTTGGSTVVQRGERLWALFPWVDGQPPLRGRIAAEAAMTIGACHGQVHAVLATHPLSTVPVAAPVFDAAEALRRLQNLHRVALEREELRLAADIEFQVRLLEQCGAARFSLASLPHSLVHGDFHDQQVLLAPNGALVAVVDWEMFTQRARAFEVIRSLSFSLLLGEPEMEAYLRGYRQNSTMTPDECELVVELWWQSRLQNSWAHRAYLMEGNSRLSGFFPAMRSELERLSNPRWRSELGARMAAGG